MELKLFKPLWGHQGPIGKAVVEAAEAGFNGIEGPAPESAEDRHAYCEGLRVLGMSYIAEVCTAGGYVPERNASVNDHLRSLESGIERSLDMNPLFITTLAGCDAWDFAQHIRFFTRALEIAEANKITLSVETHRSRSTFNPWVTRDILRELPALKITCDFSHWCAVCERLIDTEPEILDLCCQRAHHIHARVGHAQGPQVSDPSAPEHEAELEAHERWWSMIWDSQEERGMELSTMTPEFGPDGYSNTPVAELWAINCWMGHRQWERFAVR
jgi:sugar phosphate isomerase/epimerase